MNNKLESDILRSMYEAYMEVAEGRAMGKTGADGDYNPKGAAATVSSGKGSTMTPAAGLGKDKRHVNNTKGDDNRIKTYKDQVSKDKTADRGISPEARKERARQNKENTAKKGIDSLLKDIRGK